MADKPITMAELQNMTKSQLTELAKSLNINVKGMNKPEMLQKLCTQGVIGEDYASEDDEHTELITSMHSPVHKTPNVEINPIPDKTDNWQFQLEKMKLEMEMEENVCYGKWKKTIG